MEDLSDPKKKHFETMRCAHEVSRMVLDAEAYELMHAFPAEKEPDRAPRA